MALQKQFRGLQNLLGLYEAGSMSLEKPLFVGLGLDALDFLEPQQIAHVDSLGTGSDTGELDVYVTVPPEEMWLVRGIFTKNTPLAAANTAIPFVGYQSNDPTAQVAFPMSPPPANFSYAVGSRPCAGIWLNSPLAAFPGWFLGQGWYLRSGGTQATASVEVIYHKVKI